MSTQNLVIVESPAKAKTINKYLGSDYVVVASFGHVRDLVNKDGSVLPDENFAMKWEVGDRSQKHVSEIKKLAKKSNAIYLASDPDREGEAIAWHVTELLREAKALEGKDLYRVSFNEITKTAVQEAFEQARQIDDNLVAAYKARRALDYLVGFNLSPILWRKLPGSRSAGRVQSVALRLICERETEIDQFDSQEYWSIEARLHNKDGAPFTARLTHLAGNKLDKLDIRNEDEATSAVKRIQNKELLIHKIEKKQVRRNPSPPFITSTLQQEASNKLRMSAAQTMRTAQKLYEGVEIDGDTTGLITYMRTDGVTLSQTAIAQCRDVIKNDYGDKYLPSQPRIFKGKAKNAQEAHEAIRPTDLKRSPAQVKRYLNEAELKLYTLIWKRTMASQMEQAVLDQMSVDISDGTDDVVLRANGSVVTFDGFLTLYQDSDNDTGEIKNEKDRRLPPMNEKDSVKTVDVEPSQHFTQPPPRYTEASLVKKLEELGIGRPSTYASILQVLRDRNYVRMEQRRFFPEDRGRIVTAFLQKFFDRYVNYDFTANLENELDSIAEGQTDWIESLTNFWTAFKAKIEETKPLTITEVIDHLNEELGAHFFPEREDGSPPRSCQACDEGILSIKLGKFGAFIGCSNYPDCKFTRPLIQKDGDGDPEEAKLANEPKELGVDPATGRTITLRKGPYGPYVQLDPAPESKDKPKRQGLPKGTTPADMTLEAAIKLLALPREVGKHPETGKLIEAGIGRFGPFLKHDGVFTSLPKDEDLLTVGMNRAVQIIADGAIKRAEREAKKAAKAAASGKDDTKKSAKGKGKTTKKKTTKKKSTAKKSTTKKSATKKKTEKKKA